MTEEKERRSKDKELNFETALSEIDEIVEKLESGELTLDDSLRYFQRGMDLVKFCSERLDAAESRLKILIEGSDGEFMTEDAE